MSTVEMDPVFAEGLRAALAKTVGGSSRVRRRWGWRLGVGMFAGLALLGGGVAIASGVFTPPGAPSDTQLGHVVSASRTGTATVELGPAPTTVNALSLVLTCLSVGTFTFPNGSSMSCDADDMSGPPNYRTASEVVPLGTGVDSVTITTAASASWSLQVVYENQIATSWGVNAAGETYGVRNQQGTPDLIAVVIDEGNVHGYVMASELDCVSGGDVRSPAQALKWDKENQNRNISIPVYESDGATVVGTFVIDHASGPDAKTVPFSSLSLNCAKSGSGE
ncbi:MAG: hypothetical protein WA580_04770 [Acidimicrobiales bacterium]